MLEAGSVTEELLVTTEAAVVDSDSSDISLTVRERQLVDLPLNGRNFTPLALLVPCLGVYMGIFNFIVLAEIVAALGFGWVMNHLLGNNGLAAVVAGGGFLVLAALLVQRVEKAT